MLYALKNTSDKTLDGVKVFITGVAYNSNPMPGIIFIIEREDGELFCTPYGHYKNIIMTEMCLDSVD